jgi:hypothetical protein
MDYYGRLYFYSHVLNIPLMPILKPTGIIAYNGAFYGVTFLQVGSSTALYSYYAPQDVIWEYATIMINLMSQSYQDRWEIIPTEFGMYRVTVKGTYLQGLIS